MISIKQDLEAISDEKKRRKNRRIKVRNELKEIESEARSFREKHKALYELFEIRGKRLSPREIRALAVLFSSESPGWIKPRDLARAGVCGSNKTTETWKELHKRGLVQYRRKEVNDRGRMVKPTTIRARFDNDALKLLTYHLFVNPDHNLALILTPNEHNKNVKPFWLANKDKIMGIYENYAGGDRQEVKRTKA